MWGGEGEEREKQRESHSVAGWVSGTETILLHKVPWLPLEMKADLEPWSGGSDLAALEVQHHLRQLEMIPYKLHGGWVLGDSS